MCGAVRARGGAGISCVAEIYVTPRPTSGRPLGPYDDRLNSYIAEVERNIVSKRPQLLALYNSIREAVNLKIVDPTEREILRMKPHTAFKDAPHLATAKKAKVFCLVSLDRRHLVGIRDQIEKAIGVKILLPEELLAEIRAMDL
jgi:predicted nucleic acid-binding protein